MRPWRLARLACLAGAFATAIAGIAAAAATGLASGSGSYGYGTGSASTGGVLLRVDERATRTCRLRLLVPGGLARAARCALAVRYGGSIPGYLSVSVTIRSKAGTGGRPLYDGSRTSGLRLMLGDGHRRYVVPAGSGRRGPRCPAGFTCWRIPHDLAAWYWRGRPHLIFLAGRRARFTLRAAFARSAGNGYQGGSAVVRLIASAVQAPANPLPRHCTIATIGRPCPGLRRFTWS